MSPGVSSIAARVAEAARGGEILVSEVTRALVVGHAPRLAAHGTHRLKGLSAPHALYRVCWDEAAAESPHRRRAYAALRTRSM